MLLRHEVADTEMLSRRFWPLILLRTEADVFTLLWKEHTDLPAL